jgi:excisionase family DNA binding protein
MKTELEQADIQAIAEKVIHLLRPILAANGNGQEETVFDKKSLAEYLHVDMSWIDKQITSRAIPYFKAGKYTRFKRSHIDRWIESQRVDPVPELKSYRRR